jgi:hypothetical protein
MKVKLYYKLSFEFDYRVLSERENKNDLQKRKHSTINNDTLL